MDDDENDQQFILTVNEPIDAETEYPSKDNIRVKDTFWTIRDRKWSVGQGGVKSPCSPKVLKPL